MRPGGEMENKLQSKKLEAKTAEAKPDAEAKDKHYKQSLNPSEVPNIRDTESYMGSEWCGIFEVDVDFKQEHFLRAMKNLIKNPNINSTVILRSDTLKRFKYDYDTDTPLEGQEPNLESWCRERPEELIVNTEEDGTVLTKNLQDVDVRRVPINPAFKPRLETVRRMIPRNPAKDYIINQTCLILESGNEPGTTAVLYNPHVSCSEDIPYYLPPVKSIAILYRKGKLSIHYLTFTKESAGNLRCMEPTERPIRIAYRLLHTAKKHSTGVMNGYTKRVNHDRVISKEVFQDRYITLKQKYAKTLVDGWKEKTDPRKHVFEDIAIAAFLIELWKKIYKAKQDFQFRDLGCGNGLLVYILTKEGYHGLGIDARARKSWTSYPEDVQEKLKEQVIVPSVLLRPHPDIRKNSPEMKDNGKVFKVPIKLKPQYQGNRKLHSQPTYPFGEGIIPGMVPAIIPPIGTATPLQTFDNKIEMVECYSSAELLSSPKVNTAEFPQDTFIIGNHADEITCWIPLLGYPFMVIPCCSHNLNGEKIRYPINKARQENSKTLSYSSTSRYASLVDHVEDLAGMCGWKVEREMLRIPSTRNAAIVGYERKSESTNSIYDIIAREGGADRWVENTMSLTRRAPRNH